MVKRNILWRIYISIKLFGDLGLSILSFITAYYIRFYNKLFVSIFPPVKGIPDILIYYKFLPFFTAVVLLSYFYCGYYKKQILQAIDEFITVLKGSIIIGILMMAVSFFYRGYEYSRLFMLVVIIVNTFFISLWHWVINIGYVKYSKYIFGKPKIGVVGNEKMLKKIKELVAKNKSVKSFFLSSDGLNITADDIIKFVTTKNITELIVDYFVFNTEMFQNILPELDSKNIDMKLWLDMPFKLSEVAIDSTLGVPVVTLRPVVFSSVNFFTKRVIDIVVSIIVLSIFFIPAIFISLMIVLDSEGSPIYVSKRVGLKNRIINCFKFRTMVKDAHSKWWELLKYSVRGDKVLKLKNDKRVTRVGKFLRRWSIDEIPQFFNVLKGEMSIVGPRPQIVEEVSFYDSKAKKRLMTLPGLTGLWQISGRADVGFDEMLALDLYYIENWSLGLDLKIIFKTIYAIFTKKGAY